MRCKLATALFSDLRLDPPSPQARRAWLQTSPDQATPACATWAWGTTPQTVRSSRPGHMTSTAPAATLHYLCRKENRRGVAAPTFCACSREPSRGPEVGETSAPTAPRRWRVRGY